MSWRRGSIDQDCTASPHHTSPHHTTPHHTTPHHTTGTPHPTTPHHTTHTTPHHSTPQHTLPHPTTPHHSTPRHTSRLRRPSLHELPPPPTAKQAARPRAHETTLGATAADAYHRCCLPSCSTNLFRVALSSALPVLSPRRLLHCVWLEDVLRQRTVSLCLLFAHVPSCSVRRKQYN